MNPIFTVSTLLSDDKRVLVIAKMTYEKHMILKYFIPSLITLLSFVKSPNAFMGNISTAKNIKKLTIIGTKSNDLSTISALERSLLLQLIPMNIDA